MIVEMVVLKHKGLFDYNNEELKCYGENKMIRWIKKLIDKIRLERRYKKKIKELKKRDPFIYK